MKNHGISHYPILNEAYETTAYGARCIACDWSIEDTDHQKVAEAALAHADTEDEEE